ncbi:RsfA family transcriptional regulator [Pseudalkalibacillus hwajinpoensis]|uniref:RsfA family transcriptional regulator n=1 Tax=Guptibacillus hwajinpoensis TaxID=208199 RepID=A0A4U1MKR4_9BACL|nr:RsfA family transcriptional regulator [Pseudalkalibacillus hwajinpoensis]TKD71763.1 RsfA family transcriptional regulator [Pseudalkalibacillus hwajinpoensis]
MVPIRQDAWSKDEDVLLAEVVLRHIREASTQLAAFEEVGKKLSRTPAACGFRWNSLIRKQYEAAISLAKKQRKEQKKSQPENKQETACEDQSMDLIDEAIAILIKSKSYLSEVARNETSLQETLAENLQLKQHLHQLEKEYMTVQEDYQSLLEIMEKARKMVIFQEEDQGSMRFQMDANGNLEKVKK